MTDDQLREACARALGMHVLHDGPKSCMVDDAPSAVRQTRRDLPPIDGNTAMALLMLPSERWRYGWRITLEEGVIIFDGKPFWRAAIITPRNIILAALLALGEISAEDMND